MNSLHRFVNKPYLLNNIFSKKFSNNVLKTRLSYNSQFKTSIQKKNYSNNLKVHTRIEEELHEKAHIDYDRVAIKWNPSIAKLYEDALKYEDGSAISSSGALVTASGIKTGRSPKDKRIVEEPGSSEDIWWGPVNTKLPENVFLINRERAVDYLNTRKRIYVFDGFAGWDPKYRIKVRVVSARAYHALFMRNMLIRPTTQELETYGSPDFTIYNAGAFPANRYTTGMTSTTSVALNFHANEMVILGTEYAGHGGDVSLFFGLSGTGKTTLSADPKRLLIGDDEHCWSDDGIFNIEGGCYAKCIGLSPEKEPEIYNAIRFGSVLENVVYDRHTRIVNYDDSSLTENTRCAYPIEYIPNAKLPCISSGHPKNIILLTCDAYGVLPPVSKLSPAQAMYHFISGYTAKIAGTEEGVTQPEATFSACFGQPFLVLHPARYATMLAEKMKQHSADAWLINTGWNGGAYGVGERIKLKYSRAILDAIHSGELSKAEYESYDVFNLQIPKLCTGVPSELLNPSRTWKGSEDEFKKTRNSLAEMFTKNFKNYEDQATQEILSAGPVLS
ncbi:10646_t:CDS:2 [Dentiscutata erythropus]|uniref:Phosphoenolpyruvate carboxykinase (ATP) n=1 Tax=Dentiscutata erythropus TaxID=1348616 RepID=A0A9N9BF98_9GLOM|nr:10646_t:CDS:2 [Dentiscutata erythropus]